MERKSARPTDSDSISMPSRFAGGCICGGSAMNAWPIQSQWGIAIAVIVSEHRAAPMRSAACTGER